MQFRLGAVQSLPHNGESIVRQDQALTRTSEDVVRAEANRRFCKALRSGESVLVRNTGESMRPCILPGELLRVLPAASQILKPGDVVLMENGSDLIVHRLLGFKLRGNQTMAITAGDAGKHLDEPQPKDNLIGVVDRAIDGETERPLRATIYARLRSIMRLARLQTRSATQRFKARIAGASGSAGRPCFQPLAWSMPGLLENARVSYWPAFVETAKREGLAPLVYYYAREAERQSAMPDQARSLLAGVYHEVLARNTLFLERLNVFVRAMGTLPLIILKGACLAREIYPSPGLRPFSDLDVIVRPENFAEAAACLQGMNYSPLGVLPEKPDANPSGLNSVLFQAREHDPAFHLHWHVFNSTSPKYAHADLDMDSLWSAARPCAEGGMILSQEHLLLHLAEHALRHSFDRMILLRDLTEVILKAGTAMDWDRVAADGRRFGLAFPVHASLALAREMAGAAVPASTLADLLPQGGGWGEKLFLSLTRRGRRGPEWCNLVYFAALPNTIARAAFFKNLLFPSRAIMARAYGLDKNAIGSAFYARRFGRGLIKAFGLGRRA